MHKIKLKKQKLKSVIDELREILDEHHILKEKTISVEQRYTTIKDEYIRIRIENITMDNDIYEELKEILKYFEWTIQITMRKNKKYSPYPKIPEMDLLIG